MSKVKKASSDLYDMITKDDSGLDSSLRDVHAVSERSVGDAKGIMNEYKRYFGSGGLSTSGGYYGLDSVSESTPEAAQQPDTRFSDIYETALGRKSMNKKKMTKRAYTAHVNNIKDCEYEGLQFMMYDEYGNACSVTPERGCDSICSIYEIRTELNKGDEFMNSVVVKVREFKSYGVIKVVIQDPAESKNKRNAYLVEILKDAGFAKNIGFIDPRASDIQMVEYYYIIEDETDDVA